MQNNLKGLLSREVLNMELYTQVQKKAEEHQKTAQLCIDFFQQTTRCFESFTNAIERPIQDCEVCNISQPYYDRIKSIFIGLLKYNKQLSEATRESPKNLSKKCNEIFLSFIKLIQEYQLNIKNYIQYQQTIQQLTKKYFKLHKNMLTSIQSYKDSFNNVTIIYNMDQKIKRYQICQNNYKSIQYQYNLILDKLQLFTQKKSIIIKNTYDFKLQFTNSIKTIGSLIIQQIKNFIYNHWTINKNITVFLLEQQHLIEKQKLQPFFLKIKTTTKPQIFNLQKIDLKTKSNKLPFIFSYPHLIKFEYIQTYSTQVTTYLKSVQQAIQKRKQQNKKINQLFTSFYKNLDRIHTTGLKDIIGFSEKIQNKITDYFGQKFGNFFQSLFCIVQFLCGIDEKLTKNAIPKLNTIQTYLNQQTKLFQLFYDQLKSNIQKLINKKQLKKQQNSQQKQNIKIYQKQIIQKTQFLKILIQGFYNKMQTNCQNISKIYTNIIQNLNEQMCQLLSICSQYQSTFQKQIYKNKLIKYQNDIDLIIQKYKNIFQQLSNNISKCQKNKITFDGEFNKIQDFKKLKKPPPIQSLQEHRDANNTSPSKQTISSNPQSPSMIQQSMSLRSIPSISSPTKKSPQKVIQSKNQNFLLSKITFKQNEQYIKSYSCALSQKIILQGRIYITNHRICFHSGFNSHTLFFGGTFIQFPKQDIIKIQKKFNALLMGNSISITTVKGQLVFTSFFSRNETYDVICRTFELNIDDDIYQIQNEYQQQSSSSKIILDIKQIDDINQNQIQIRKQNIQPLLFKFPYEQGSTIEISQQLYNAYQIFKIFYANNQITIKRKKYPNFITYLKLRMDQKNLQIEQWVPPLQQLMNQSTIKSNSPLTSTRKVRTTVPIVNPGIPFLPKQAQSQETQNLYIFSKYKWIIESTAVTTGAPYADTFTLQIRTTATSDDKGNCKLSIGFYINFLKNSLMKSVIKQKTSQQTIQALKFNTKQILTYIKQQNKNKNKKEQKQLNNQQQIQKNQQQILQQKQQNLSILLRDALADKQKYKKIILLLAIVNFFFLILLIL